MIYEADSEFGPHGMVDTPVDSGQNTDPLPNRRCDPAAFANLTEQQPSTGVIESFRSPREVFFF